jgi:transcriptional regulator with XRE-family HTH domain
MMSIMGFRENLKAELSYNDILVKELAAQSGVNKRTIDNYLRENGPCPSADSAVCIARALGVSVEYLITGRETRRENPYAALAPDLRRIFRSLEKLSPADRKVVLNLVESLLEQVETP